jgi:hypothetical protein
MSDHLSVTPEMTKTVRPLCTQALHLLFPGIPMVDCAAAVNRALDAAEDGDVEAARQLHAALTALLRASDAAEQQSPRTPS